MTIDNKLIGEAYTTQVPATPVITRPAIANTNSITAPGSSITTASQNNQEEVPKSTSPVKDWIRLPFIDTPFKARMAAVLIVELIFNLTKDQGLRDLVLKEIKTSNRLHKR